MKKSLIHAIAIVLLWLNATTFSSCSSSKNMLIEYASGYILSRAIYTAATIKVADCLVDGPCHIAQLAEKTESNPDALYRLMRFLASYAIFQENQDGSFELTPLAQQLVSTDPESLWAWITYHHEPNRWTAYATMEHSIKSGSPEFNHLFGKGYFDFIADSPLLSTGFDEGMKNISADENAMIVSAYNFNSYHTIADIGGGTGGLLADIVTNYPMANGILFDLPHVEISARNALNANIQFIPSHGFFDPIPCNADLYILKRILHDWNDQDCITILHNCYAAMPDHAHLLIIEAIVAEENVRDIVKDIDIEMMVLFGGKERTKREWEQLLEQAHFNIVAIHSTSSLLSIIEVTRDDKV